MAGGKMQRRNERRVGRAGTEPGFCGGLLHGCDFELPQYRVRASHATHFKHQFPFRPARVTGVRGNVETGRE